LAEYIQQHFCNVKSTPTLSSYIYHVLHPVNPPNLLPLYRRHKIPTFITSGGTITPQTPVLLDIYDGLGVSVIPHFRADFVKYLQAFSGVPAIPNIRGGGEYGEKWYAAACKTLRQNLFDDVISAVNYVRSEFKTASSALMRESMGGLNASSVIIQQPSLLQGVFLNVAVIDILRRVRLSREGRGTDDESDPEIPAEFDFIASYAPLGWGEVSCGAVDGGGQG
jgi:prolyl oligopeptidase